MAHHPQPSSADIQGSSVAYQPETPGNWTGAPAWIDDAIDKLAATAAQAKGDTGATGAAGPTGSDGPRGLQGVPGASGSATAYTPSDATKWAAAAPTTIAGALDRIAAVLGASVAIP